MTQLNQGDMAPDFELPADDGTAVRLADLKGTRVVLYFYPKDDTPGCTKQSCGFRDNHAVLTSKNAVVFGISPDGAASHQKFRKKFEFPFRLLADAGHTVAEAYGVWVEKSMYGKKYMGIERSHFVIGEDGRLLQVARKVKPEESVVKALAALG